MAQLPLHLPAATSFKILGFEKEARLVKATECADRLTKLFALLITSNDGASAACSAGLPHAAAIYADRPLDLAGA